MIPLGQGATRRGDLQGRPRASWGYSRRNTGQLHCKKQRHFFPTGHDHCRSNARFLEGWPGEIYEGVTALYSSTPYRLKEWPPFPIRYEHKFSSLESWKLGVAKYKIVIELIPCGFVGCRANQRLSSVHDSHKNKKKTNSLFLRSARRMRLYKAT